MTAVLDLTVVDGPAQAGAATAARVVAELSAVLASRSSASLAVSGGTTPGPLFDALATGPIDWRSVHLFQVDERVAPAGGPDRNWTMLGERLLSSATTAGIHPHPMPVDDLAVGVDAYTAALEAVCGRPPVLDVVHLGLGTDGHTASLFPGDDVLDVTDRDVALTSADHGGLRRMTMTRPLLERSRRIVWLVTGADKAVALRDLLEGGPTPAGCLRRPGDVVVADRAAVGTGPG